MELSNAVTVLIARMESHPDDFELWGPHRAKFAGTAEALCGLVGIDEDKKNAFWYLSDADKEALIAAWKKLHLAKFEKDVMETIFDDGYEQRQREAEMQRTNMQLQQQAYQRAQMQNQRMNAAQQSPGQFVPISNPAQSSGGFLSGIFK